MILPRRSRVLIPLELPDPEPLPEDMIRSLGSLAVLLLGWFETPEQTPPEQARAEVEDSGRKALETMGRRLTEAGAEVETRQVFTPDLLATVQRIGAEEKCDAALLAAPVRKVERVLVLLREGVTARTLVPLLVSLLEGGERRATLLQISRDEANEGRRWSQDVLEALRSEGVDTDRVDTRVQTAEDPAAQALEACREGDFDLALIPERGELEDQLFGSFAHDVATEAPLPVLVVRVSGEDAPSPD